MIKGINKLTNLTCIDLHNNKITNINGINKLKKLVSFMIRMPIWLYCLRGIWINKDNEEYKNVLKIAASMISILLFLDIYWYILYKYRYKIIDHIKKKFIKK